MFNFTIYKTTIWKNDKPEKLESFKIKDIKKGMRMASDKMQRYVNNGTVNDYTSFTQTILILSIGKKRYHVWDDAKTLVWDASITQ